MYQVFWGDYLLHDLRLDEYILINPTLTEELNKISELTFTILSGHPYFNKLEKLIPNISLKKDGQTLFRGRIINDSQKMNKSKEINCESFLAFLFDSLQRTFDFQETPKNFFCRLLNVHNNQVATFSKTTDVSLDEEKIYFTYSEELGIYEQVLNPSVSEIANYYEATGSKVLYIGKTTGANLDNNEYINRSSEDYISTYETIEDKILETIGGYIKERYVNDQTFIDWVNDFTEGEAQIVSTQVIQFGENLIDLAIDDDASETYSVVIPLGAEIENEDGTTERLTIESVNDGKDYLINETALEKYGWIVAPISETTWDDVTLPANLKAKATDYLNNKAVMLKSTLEVNGLDLNTINKNVSDFRMGQYIKVQSIPHNISKTYLLTKKQTPLTKPEELQITLGETKNTLTGMQVSDKNDTIKRFETVLKDYVLNENITQIVDEEISNSSLIQQLPNEILTSVGETYTAKSEMEQFIQSLNTQLSQTEEGWEFQFQQIISQITNIDGTVNENYQQLIEYIRFVGGKIILGEVGNEITLELQNDRLSFMQNESEVAYVSNGKLYITDGEFTNSLTIGNFAYLPRTNGNLSFKKVKG